MFEILPPNLSGDLLRRVEKAPDRVAGAVTTFIYGGCPGGWALPYHTPCPECGAIGDGRCTYDSGSVLLFSPPEHEASPQADLFGGAA